MEIIQPRLILQREFAQRCERNPRYSLRAFARSLGLSHSTLSMVLAGKRRLSRKMFTRVSGSLHLTPDESNAVSRLTGAEDLGFIETAEDEQYHQISMDTFTVMSEWYHYGILCLLLHRNSQFSAAWFSERLGITLEQAQAAMDRLVRLGMVARVGRNWRPSTGQTKVENPIQLSTEATRKFHTQLLLKAIESLNNDPAERRLFNGMSMNIDPEQLPNALTRIRNFQRRLSKELESKGNTKRVYSLNIQLFPLDKEPKRPQ